MRILFLALLTLLLLRVAFGPPPVFLLDDAYITYHSARSLTAATDRCFPETRPAEAATSLVHATVTWALGQALPGLWALEATIWVFASVYLAGLLVLTRALPTWVRAGIAVVGFGTAGTPFHLLSGLELPIALAALTWLWIGWQRHAWWTGVLAGALPWIRPELALVSVIVTLAAVRSHRWRIVAAGAAGGAVWALWAWWLTGSLVPVTVMAKRAFLTEAAQPLLSRATSFAGAIGTWGLMAGPAVAALAMFARRLPWVAAAIVIWLGTFLPAHPTALYHNYGRYMHLLVPALVLGTVWVCESRKHLAVPLLASVAVWIILLVPTHYTTITRERAQYGGELPALASWLAENSPPAPILVHDVGYICQVPLPYVDLVGLKSPVARGIHQRLTATDGGRSRQAAIAAIACETRPRTLVVLVHWDQDIAITDTLRSAGWTLVPLRPRVEKAEYAVYALDDREVVCPSGHMPPSVAGVSQ